MNKKITALVISVIMLISLMTTVAFAAGGNVAEVNGTEYATLQEAFDAAGAEGKVTLIDNIELSPASITSYIVKVNAGEKITLDLAGHTVSVVDNNVDTGSTSANFEVIYNLQGELTVIDSSEAKTGAITLESTNDRSWNSMSTIFHNRGGKLTIEAGTFANNGGTDMAFVVDNSSNSFGPATLNIEGGKLSSTYTAIRAYMSANTDNIVNINGGTIEGVSRAIWGQAPENNTAGQKCEVTVSDGTITNVEGGRAIDIARAANTESMLTIEGGTVEGEVKAKAGEIEITGGEVNGKLTILDAAGNAATNVEPFITGGSFSEDVEEYVKAENGNELIENEDGTFDVGVPVEVKLVASPEKGGSVAGAGSFAKGKKITVTATAKEGYEFVGWFENDDEVSKEASYTFEANETTLTAEFKVKEAAAEKEEVKNPPTGYDFSPKFFIALQVMALASIGAMLVVNKAKNIK